VGGRICIVIVGVGDENDRAYACAFHNRRDSVAQSIITYAVREMSADDNRLLVIADTLKLLDDERTVVF